ncbi:hypothetical protein HDV63DRAFT_386619 [Trichoderma sp. SZMC 28014]
MALVAFWAGGWIFITPAVVAMAYCYLFQHNSYILFWNYSSFCAVLPVYLVYPEVLNQSSVSEGLPALPH